MGARKGWELGRQFISRNRDVNASYENVCDCVSYHCASTDAHYEEGPAGVEIDLVIRRVRLDFGTSNAIVIGEFADTMMETSSGPLTLP